MKKILLALALVATMVSCANEEIIDSHKEAIKFGDAFIDNATRAAIDGTYTLNGENALGQFEVYATITNSNNQVANLFGNADNGELVTKDDAGNWNYNVANTQYWVPGNTYDFRAIVDGNVAGVSKVTTTDKFMASSIVLSDASAQKDILFAEAADVDYTAGSGAKTVSFTFNHLLSKVKFTFNNTIATNNGYSYLVKGIKINNTNKDAEYLIEEGKWSFDNYVATCDLAFGNAVATSDAAGAEATAIAYNGSVESNWERLLIPSTASRNITFTTELLKDGVVIDTQNRTIDTDEIELVQGHSYNFVVSLGNPGEPIKFDVVKVNDWVEENVNVNVSTANEFFAAFEEKDHIILGGNINLNDADTRAIVDPTLVVKNGQTKTIDLNGYTLSATSTGTGKNYDMLLVKGELTITNGTIFTEHLGANMGWGAMTTIFDITAGGVLNLNGVNAINKGGSDMNFVAHLNNWGTATLNVDNSTLEATYIAVRAFNSGNDMNNITIANSTLKGKYCFWVHNYKAAGDSQGDDSTLNVDIFGKNNTFNYTGVAPVLYGFNEPIYFDENGQEITNVVTSVEELKDALVNAGAAGAGDTEINLAAGEYTMPADWTPITVDGYHGADIVTINGNGAVLKGMTTSLFDGGFAGGSGIVIKDLTIEGATIVADNTQGYGAFVNCADSMAEITLINCHLIDSTIITPNDGANESRIGGLVGWTSGYSNQNDGPVKTYVTIQNCSVVGCTIKGAGSIGGICGHAGASDWTYTTIEDCVVKNNTLISTDAGSWRVGVAVGTANVGEVVINNLTESGNTLVQGDLTDSYTGARRYAGRLALGTTGTFVVDGVAITE